MDWTKQAGSMADHYQGFLAPAMFEPCAELLLDAAGVTEGMKVLDVACGTGVVSRVAARRAGADGAVVGVDLAPPMIEVARAQPPEAGAAPIDYREGDVLALPVPDGGFDVVVCQHGLQFFSDKPAALREMARALRPGGTVAIACWAPLDGNPYMQDTVASLRDHVGEEAAAGMRMPFSLGADDIEALLGGFDDVSVQVLAVPTAFRATPEEAAVRMVLAGPLAPMFTELPEAQRNAFRDGHGAKIAQYDTGDGYLRPPMHSSIATARRPDAHDDAKTGGAAMTA